MKNKKKFIQKMLAAKTRKSSQGLRIYIRKDVKIKIIRMLTQSLNSRYMARDGPGGVCLQREFRMNFDDFRGRNLTTEITKLTIVIFGNMRISEKFQPVMLVTNIRRCQSPPPKQHPLKSLQTLCMYVDPWDLLLKSKK